MIIDSETKPNCFATALLVTILSISGVNLRAQTTQTNNIKIPAAAVMPWEAPFIDRELLDSSKASLQKARQLISKKVLANPLKLDQWLKQQQIKQSIMSSKRSSTIYVGELAPGVENTLTGPLIVQPVLCAIGDQLIIQLQITDRNNVWLQATHTTVPFNKWGDDLQNQILTNSLTEQVNNLWNNIQNKGEYPEPKSLLKIGLSLASETMSPKTGSGTCLNQIVAELYLKDWQFIRTLGQLNLIHMFDLLKINDGNSRSNRRLILGWDFKNRTFPLKTQLTMRSSEGVFAAGLSYKIKADVDITNQNGINLQLPAQVVENINQEKNSVEPDTLPMAAKIYKAWVYLDRGRAWGLKMNDRLILKNGNTLVKGHIVGFYGPQYKFKSPRGFPIQEGAIMFIRTGQKLTKVGQIYEYDKTQFPTQWPPKTTPP